MLFFSFSSYISVYAYCKLLINFFYLQDAGVGFKKQIIKNNFYVSDYYTTLIVLNNSFYCMHIFKMWIINLNYY